MLDTLPPPRIPGKGSSVYVPKALLERIGRFAKVRKQTRSACAADLLKAALDGLDGGVKPAKVTP